MKKLLFILFIAFTSCIEIEEPYTFELTIPSQLHGDWESEHIQRTITPTKVIDNGVELVGYHAEGRDYDSDFGYYIEFRKENYPVVFPDVEYTYVRLVFGFAWGENLHENIIRLLDEHGTEVYTTSEIIRFTR